MADSGWIEATNKIRYTPDFIKNEYEVEAVSEMYAGRLLIKGTTDNEVSVAGANAVNGVGWLGYEDTPLEWRPATVDTIYVVNGRAAVIKKPGMAIRAQMAAGQTPVRGDEVIAAADGKLAVATYDTSHNIQYRSYGYVDASFNSGKVIIISSI